MNKLILLERDFPRSYLETHNRVKELSVDQVVKKYQGFQGDLIRCAPLKDNKLELGEDIQYFLNQGARENHLALCITENSLKIPQTYKNLVYFVGFDVGVCEQEKTIYSSLFNEVLFGNIDELIVYKDALNEHLLLPSEALALQYIITHDQLSAEGKDVEDYEKMNVYEIWKIQLPEISYLNSRKL